MNRRAVILAIALILLPVLLGEEPFPKRVDTLGVLMGPGPGPGDPGTNPGTGGPGRGSGRGTGPGKGSGEGTGPGNGAAAQAKSAFGADLVTISNGQGPSPESGTARERSGRREAARRDSADPGRTVAARDNLYEAPAQPSIARESARRDELYAEPQRSAAPRETARREIASAGPTPPSVTPPEPLPPIQGQPAPSSKVVPPQPAPEVKNPSPLLPPILDIHSPTQVSPSDSKRDPAL